MGKVPAVRQIYNSAKEVIQVLFGTGATRAAFREVVLMQFPRPGMSAANEAFRLE
jgi:uncharacterized membrane protein